MSRWQSAITLKNVLLGRPGRLIFTVELYRIEPKQNRSWICLGYIFNLAKLQGDDDERANFRLKILCLVAGAVFCVLFSFASIAQEDSGVSVLNGGFEQILVCLTNLECGS